MNAFREIRSVKISNDRAAFEESTDDSIRRQRPRPVIFLRNKKISSAVYININLRKNAEYCYYVKMLNILMVGGIN